MGEKISIGDDQWIEFEIHADDRGDAADIDTLLDDSWPLWRLLETECVAACCGIDAFAFSPKAVRSAHEAVGTDAAKQLAILKNQIENLGASTLLSARFNQLFAKPAFVRLVDHMIAHL